MRLFWIFFIGSLFVAGTAVGQVSVNVPGYSVQVDTASGKTAVNEAGVIDSDVEIEGIVKEDFDQLIPAILSEEADLIVMGSEGANGWKDYLSGTNSQNVIRKADCPVLVLKENTQLDKLERILFETDFEKTGFIEKSQELLNLKNTKNHFVFIDAGEYDEDRKELYDRAKEVEKEYKIQNFDFEIYHHDNIPGGIIQYAEKLKIDLIVMYTHGRKGMQRFLFGSIAEQVVNSSTTPVLSVLEH